MTHGCGLDTNILIFLVNRAAPEHGETERSVELLAHTGQRPLLAQQVLFEFWVAATRPPEVNGMGWSTFQTRAAVETLRQRFLVLAEPEGVLDRWLDLVVRHQLKGKRIHDAHLLATLQAHGVSLLLTANPTDFPSVSDIAIVTPQSLLAGHSPPPF